jgi:hypothetical protein
MAKYEKDQKRMTEREQSEAETAIDQFSDVVARAIAREHLRRCRETSANGKSEDQGEGLGPHQSS